MEMHVNKTMNFRLQQFDELCSENNEVCLEPERVLRERAERESGESGEGQTNKLLELLLELKTESDFTDP